MLFLARCCLGQVPGGAPFSQRRPTVRHAVNHIRPFTKATIPWKKNRNLDLFCTTAKPGTSCFLFRHSTKDAFFESVTAARSYTPPLVHAIPAAQLRPLDREPCIQMANRTVSTQPFSHCSALISRVHHVTRLIF